MMFIGEKFCSHCGARADRKEGDAPLQQLCPRCRVRMTAVKVGDTPLSECTRCEGIWADKISLEQICADRERQAAVLGMPSPVTSDLTGQIETVIRYVPCPVCNKLMNRINFAKCSHVVVDVCALHGTWFDRDELRRIVEFIRAGGLDAARAKEIAALEEQRRSLKAAQTAGAWETRVTEDPNSTLSLLRMLLG
jgi:Zn-finger nucleic acid-binding protein